MDIPCTNQDLLPVDKRGRHNCRPRLILLGHIQDMGVEMTVKTIRELAVHALAVRFAMAGGAFRHYLMLPFVTVGAQQGPVLP